jgi:hypothetical protein
MLQPILSRSRRRRIGATYLDRLLATNPTSYWPLDDPAGRTARELSGRIGAPADTVFYGSFETAGAGDPDFFEGWGEAAGDGAIADETTLVHSGSHAAKLTSGASDNTRVTNGLPRVSPGQTYTYSFYTRGDGSNAGKFAIRDNTNNTWIVSLQTTGVSGTSYTEVSGQFVAPAGCHELIVYLWGPSANGGIAYFDDLTITGPVDCSGYYSASGVSYRVAGMGDGRTAVQVDGTGYIQFGNRGYDQFWDGDAGSAIAWGRVSAAGQWTDATIRYLWHPKASNDNTYYLVLGKHSDNHTMMYRRRAGGTTFAVHKTFSPAGPLTWFCMGMTWDNTLATPHAACYLYANGTFEIVHDESPPPGGMDAWGAHPVDDENAVLLAGSPTSQQWIGRGAHMAYWAGRELGADQMRALMVP